MQAQRQHVTADLAAATTSVQQTLDTLARQMAHLQACSASVRAATTERTYGTRGTQTDNVDGPQLPRECAGLR
jgi:hypothetical protein